jgi:hypothetical protein
LLEHGSFRTERTEFREFRFSKLKAEVLTVSGIVQGTFCIIQGTFGIILLLAAPFAFDDSSFG